MEKIKINSVLFNGRLYVDLLETLSYLRIAAEHAKSEGKTAINEIADIMEKENQLLTDKERD